ncbi:MAG: glycosyltransferase family 4 protein [Nitrospirales bacterium]|nr:glycosyltransferase family 4 protein [Nitrospirales bacterium]
MIRVAVVGQMVGRNRGYVTTQGEILSDGLEKEGYRVVSVSALPNRYLRVADIIKTLIYRKRDIDLQCLQVYSGPSFFIADIASKLGKILGQKMVMVLHGGALPEFMVRFPRWTCRVLKRADALIAPSAFLARAVVPYGLHVQVIPNIIHLSHYPYRHRQIIGPRLFWMRKFHPIYNPDLAIRVLARLKNKIPEASLVMGGQGGILELEVRRLAEKLGVASSIRFLGYLDMAAKVKEGDAADIFLNTNHIDNMPIAVVEACAMGLPVVATAVGGVPDLLTDEETGLLVPDDDDDAMAGAVMRLLADSKLTGRLSAKGRQLAAHSSWEEIFPQWERVFNEVMDSREQLR